MATGIQVLQSYEEGDRCVTEDGAGVIRRITSEGGEFVCRVLLDQGGEFDYDLETLGEEIDVNRTCKAFGICDGEVIGERRRSDEKFPEPICAAHNQIADDQGWPDPLEPYRDPLQDPP